MSQCVIYSSVWRFVPRDCSAAKGPLKAQTTCPVQKPIFQLLRSQLLILAANDLKGKSPLAYLRQQMLFFFMIENKLNFTRWKVW